MYAFMPRKKERLTLILPLLKTESSTDLIFFWCTSCFGSYLANFFCLTCIFYYQVESSGSYQDGNAISNSILSLTLFHMDKPFWGGASATTVRSPLGATFKERENTSFCKVLWRTLLFFWDLAFFVYKNIFKYSQLSKFQTACILY